MPFGLAVFLSYAQSVVIVLPVSRFPIENPMNPLSSYQVVTTLLKLLSPARFPLVSSLFRPPSPKDADKSLYHSAFSFPQVPSYESLPPPVEQNQLTFSPLPRPVGSSFPAFPLGSSIASCNGLSFPPDQRFYASPLEGWGHCLGRARS